MSKPTVSTLRPRGRMNCCGFAYATVLWTVSWLLCGSNAISTTYHSGDQVQVAWQVSTSPVGKGNGAFLSPRGDALVVLSSDGQVRALDPEDGELLWSYPSTPGATSSSGVFFSPNAPIPYVADCITSGGSTRCVHQNCAMILLARFGASSSPCAPADFWSVSAQFHYWNQPGHGNRSLFYRRNQRRLCGDTCHDSQWTLHHDHAQCGRSRGILLRL
jgi:PQQ enzyme repeat